MSEGIYPIREIKADWSKKPSNWHTGKPTEEGLYVVAFRLARVNSWSEEIHYQLFIFRDGRWMFDANYKILAWQKIEPYGAKKK